MMLKYRNLNLTYPNYPLFIVHKNYELPFGEGIIRTFYVLAIAFLLVPLHEFIHVLAYTS